MNFERRPRAVIRNDLTERAANEIARNLKTLVGYLLCDVDELADGYAQRTRMSIVATLQALLLVGQRRRMRPRHQSGASGPAYLAVLGRCSHGMHDGNPLGTRRKRRWYRPRQMARGAHASFPSANSERREGAASVDRGTPLPIRLAILAHTSSLGPKSSWPPLFNTRTMSSSVRALKRCEMTMTIALRARTCLIARASAASPSASRFALGSSSTTRNGQP